MRTAASGDLPRREEGRPARARAGAAAPGCAASRGRAGKRAGERMPDLNFKRIMGGGQRTRLRQSAMRATGGRQDAERASCQRGAGQARGRGAHKNNMATASVRAPVGSALRDASPATRRRAWTQRHACARARTGARQCGAPNTNIVAHDWAQAAPRMAPRRREGSGRRAARQGLRARAALKVTSLGALSSAGGLQVGGANLLRTQKN